MTNISNGKKKTKHKSFKKIIDEKPISLSHEKKQHWKGGTLLAPIPPALVTVGTMEHPNVLTIAWTGILNTIPPKTYISVRKERHSYPTLLETPEFVINLPSANLVKAVDFCGVRSGKNLDKFKEMNLSLVPAVNVATPLISECPLHLECKITDSVDLGTHTIFLADIVGMNVSEACIDKNGKLQIEKCNLLAFAHGEYFTLGKKLGSFGYSVRKKKNKPSKS
ncbi:MAG: flavin reductase family protein [Clostridia bacterium]|nr:flavin reductase family protein [Clostridia bacterium]